MMHDSVPLTRRRVLPLLAAFAAPALFFGCSSPQAGTVEIKDKRPSAERRKSLVEDAKKKAGAPGPRRR